MGYEFSGWTVRRLRLEVAIAVAMLWVAVSSACPSSAELRLVTSAHARESQTDTESVRRAMDPDLDTGIMLRPVDGRSWGARLQLPFSVGLAQFDRLSDVSLDQLATLALVPTVEFIVPIDERWTLLPFLGVGGVLQLGSQELVGDRRAVGLFAGGMRLQAWQPFAERYEFRFMSQVRYDATLTSRKYDWGTFDIVFELRRAFGAPHDEPRFQAGAWVRGFWFWDPVELDIVGVSPIYEHRERQIGLSLGATSAYKLWGMPVPRVFVGYGFGNGLRTLRIRFGRL